MTASEVLVKVTLAVTLSTRVSDVPFSVPLPVQPADGEGIAARPVSVRLAVVILLKPSIMPSVEDSAGVGQGETGTLARRHRVAGGRGVGERPAAVQPLTVKVLPPAVSVRLAVVNPLSVRVGCPVTASEVLVKVDVGRRPCRPGSPDEPVSVPFPVQPVTVKVLPPLVLVSVRLAVVMPLKRQRCVGPDVSDVLVNVKPATLDRRDDARAGVGQRPASGPAADRERLAATGGGEVGGRDAAQAERHAVGG